jgi:hypothetical protein
MQFLPPGKEINSSIIFAVKCISFTFFFGILISCGFYIGSAMISSVTSNSNSITPTSAVGIKDREKCQQAGKIWDDYQCWDDQNFRTNN